MNEVWAYLIEFAFLGLMGLLYYLFQRRKIIQIDKYELIEDIKILIEELESQNSEELNKFVMSLREGIEKEDFNYLYSCFSNHLSLFENELSEEANRLVKRLEFYRKKSN